MLNRILVLLSVGENVEVVIESAKNIQKEYKCEVEYIYIKNRIASTNNNAYTTFGGNFPLEMELENQEKTLITKLSQILNNKTNKQLKIIEGESIGNLLKEIKYYDLLLLGRTKTLSKLNKEILQYHYKPLIFINEKPIEFKNIVFANDKTIRSNKSLFSFLNIFDLSKELKSISINSESKDNNLEEYLKNSKLTFEFEEHKGDIFKILEKETENSGLVVCGNLGHSYMYEKITRNEGLKIISELTIPLFIM